MVSKAKYKHKLIDLIIQKFVESGEQFNCIASFNSVRSYARELALDANEKYGFVYSTSNYFPLISSGDNLQYWAAKKYLENNYTN